MKLLAGLVLLAAAQDFNLSDPAATRRPAHSVTYIAEPQTVAAGKPAVLHLRFHVLDGFHINSHRPKDALLHATELELPPTAGVKLAGFSYPAGQPLRVPADPPELLDVYAGNFTVGVPLSATPGNHILTGALHYQACDQAMCYPPKTLPVSIEFTAR